MSSSTPIATPAGAMDPNAPMPSGEPFILAPLRPSAPFSGPGSRLTAAAMRALAPVPKPLRPSKERQPRATVVDRQQVRNAPPTPAALRSVVPQPRLAPPAAPALGIRTFKGGQDHGAGIPPDTAGAVGPAHVFNPLNDMVSIFDHMGNSSPGFPIPLDDFWQQLLGTRRSTFDPKVVFDPHEGRFVLVTMADAAMPTSSLYIAVSETADPTGAWVADSFQVDDEAQGQVWLDYPTLGFSSDKVTVQVNMFTRDGNNFADSTIYVFDKRTLYDPPHRAAVQRFVLRKRGGTQVPAVTYDAGISDQFLLSTWTGNVEGGGFLAAYRISGSPVAGRATLTRLGFVTSGGATWDSFPPGGGFAPQQGIPDKVDVGDDRLLSVCLRGGVLYCSHMALLPDGGPNRSAAQWWEIDAATFAVNTLGRVDDPTGSTFFAFPTLAVNARDDLLIGLAQFTAGSHPSAAFVYRPRGGPAQPPQVFAAGLDTYNKTNGGPANRWGDYSATQPDPGNDFDFWTVQEYAEAPADRWGTMWARITVPPVAVAAAGPADGGAEPTG
jgi:hypothetical protein